MLAEQLVDNPYMASRIKKCRDLTASGRGFAEAVLTSGIFSKIYTSMITIAFRTGSMDEVMHQISEEYEEETDRQIAGFISVLEPTLAHYPVHFHRTHFDFFPSASHWHYVKYRLKVTGKVRFFYDTIENKKEKKMRTFPVSKAAARTVFPVKCCYMRTVLKSIYLISGKDPLSYTLTGLQEKHPQKIQAETGILLFSHTPHIHFSSVYAFSPDSVRFYMPKVQKLFCIL